MAATKIDAPLTQSSRARRDFLKWSLAAGVALTLDSAVGQTPAAKRTGKRDAGVRDPKDMHAKFESLFNAGDMDGLLGLYERDAVLNASPEGPVRGLEAIRKALQGFLAIGGKLKVTTKAVLVRPNGIALTHAEWALTGGSMDMGGKSAEVLRRQPDGRWLYVIDNAMA